MDSMDIDILDSIDNLFDILAAKIKNNTLDSKTLEETRDIVKMISLRTFTESGEFLMEIKSKVM